MSARATLLLLALLTLLFACAKNPPPQAQAAGRAPYVAAMPPLPAHADTAAAGAGAGASRKMLDDWLAAWNSHDTAMAANLLAPDVEYFDAGFSGIQHGREAAIDQGMSVFLRGVPDLHIELRGEPVVGRDAVAWEWTFTGTNTGAWGGIHATNQHIQLKGFSLMRLRGGRIVQLSSYYDTGTLNRQLGL
jgi:steroid delta-isomerase-like uncharacterized protein